MAGRAGRAAADRASHLAPDGFASWLDLMAGRVGGRLMMVDRSGARTAIEHRLNHSISQSIIPS